MTADPDRSYARRLARTRDDIRQAGLDALVVTHLPNLRYLTGLNASAGAVIVTAARAWLLVDFRYTTAARALLGARSDEAIEVELAEPSYDEAIVAVLQREGAARVGIEAASMPVSRFNRLSAGLAAVEAAGISAFAEAPRFGPALVATERIIERRRMVKDEAEIVIMREAAGRLSAVARQLRRVVQEGRSEIEVAAEIDSAIRAAGFERPAFDTIVASGPNAALPHARPGGRRLRRGDGVVLDFGGVYDGYSVDLTRTLHIGSVAPELARMFGAVAEAHAAAIAAVRPGVQPSRIDAAARDVLGRHGLADAFGHGTGHGLGLEVHEDPRISRLPAAKPDLPVEPGMIFTIEPGAYVAGVGGVRIEDDVLVVDGGCDVLTDVPIEL